MTDGLLKSRTSIGKMFWMLCLLIILELTVVSGRVNGFLDLRNYTSTGQKIHTVSERRGSVGQLEDAGLWSARRTGTVLGIGRGRQKIITRIVSRLHAQVCSLFLFCFFSGMAEHFFAYYRKKLHSYTEHIISYLYCLAYL